MKRGDLIKFKFKSGNYGIIVCESCPAEQGLIYCIFNNDGNSIYHMCDYNWKRSVVGIYMKSADGNRVCCFEKDLCKFEVLS